MNNTRYLELDFYRTSYRSVKTHQYDKDTRFIEVTCINDADIYPLDPETMTCDLKLITPDKRHMFKQETIQANGTVLIALEESMLLASGVCKAELNIYAMDSHKLLSTMPFDLIVIGSVYDNSIIEESDEFSVLNDMIFYNKELGDRLEQLESNVEDAEAVRGNNENTRIENELSRVNAEESRAAEENKRAADENTRKNNESDRQAAEEERVNNENIRLSDESDRKAKEIEREENESIRIQNEINRKLAEDIREQNEIDRSNAEAMRKDDFKTMQDVNAEELEKMKEAGSASEIASAAYAAAAKTSADEAKESETKAKISETNSKTSETNTKASETNSKISETNAKTSEEESKKAQQAAETAQGKAEDFAAKAESFAKGGTGTREGEDEDSARFYYEQVKHLTERVSNALVPMGTVTSERLMTITDAQTGDMYNISDEFVTTDAFEEGAGKVIPVGANVYWTQNGKWDVQAGTTVTGVKGNEETVYRKGNVNLTIADIGATGAKTGDDGYWMLTSPTGDDFYSLRTPIRGLLPYKDDPSSETTSDLGATADRFRNIYAEKLYGMLFGGVESTYCSSDTDMDSITTPGIYYIDKQCNLIVIGNVYSFLCQIRCVPFIDGTELEIRSGKRADMNNLSSEIVWDEWSYIAYYDDVLPAFKYVTRDVSFATRSFVTIRSGFYIFDRGGLFPMDVPPKQYEQSIPIEIINYSDEDINKYKGTLLAWCTSANTEINRTPPTFYMWNLYNTETKESKLYTTVAYNGEWGSWREIAYKDDVFLKDSSEGLWLERSSKLYVYGSSSGETTQNGYYKMISRMPSAYMTYVIRIRITSDNLLDFAVAPTEFTLTYKIGAGTASPTLQVYGEVNGLQSNLLSDYLFLKYPNTGLGEVSLYFNRKSAYQNINMEVLFETERRNTEGDYVNKNFWVKCDNGIIEESIEESGYTVVPVSEKISVPPMKADSLKVNGVDEPYKLYGNPGSLGLTEESTLLEICNAMPDRSEYMINGLKLSFDDPSIPNEIKGLYANLRINKTNRHGVTITIIRFGGFGLYQWAGNLLDVSDSIPLTKVGSIADSLRVNGAGIGWKMYSTTAALGLTDSKPTLKQILDAMPNCSEFMHFDTQLNDADYPDELPVGSWLGLHIWKYNNYAMHIFASILVPNANPGLYYWSGTSSTKVALTNVDERTFKKFIEWDVSKWSSFADAPTGIYRIRADYAQQMPDKPNNDVGVVYLLKSDEYDDKFMMAWSARNRKTWVNYYYGDSTGWSGWNNVYTNASPQIFIPDSGTGGQITLRYSGNGVTESEAIALLAFVKKSDGGIEIRSMSPTEMRKYISAIGCVLTDGQWGLTSPTGNQEAYLRTTKNGLLPYERGNAGGGHSNIGDPSWYFADAYIDRVHGRIDYAHKLIDSASGGEIKASFDATGTTSDAINYLACWHYINDIPNIKAMNSVDARMFIRAMGAVSLYGYYGMTWPNGNAIDYIRTSSSGLIPYQNGNSENGHSNIGTSTWYFKNGHIQNMFINKLYFADTGGGAAPSIHASSSAKNITFYPSGIETNDALTFGVTIGLVNGVPHLCSVRDNKYNLGNGSMRWSQIYAVTSTISTSDRTKKKDIKLMSEDLTQKFILGLSAMIYKMIDGDSGRTHWGFIAQDVEELMNSIGMSSLDFAGFIKSPKVKAAEKEEYVDEEKSEEITDENGEVSVRTYTEKVLQKRTIYETVEGEYDYGLRYEEFIAPTIKVVQIEHSRVDALVKTVDDQQRQIDELKKQNKELQERLSKIEATLGIS